MQKLIRQLLERKENLKTQKEELENKKESIELDIDGKENEVDTLNECSYKLSEILTDLEYLDYYFDKSSLEIMRDDIDEKVNDIEEEIDGLNNEIENIEDLIEEIEDSLEEVNHAIESMRDVLINSYKLEIELDITEEELIELDIYDDFIKIDRGEL